MNDLDRVAAMPNWLANCLPGPGTFVERLSGPFPWVRYLSAGEREAFADQLVSTASADGPAPEEELELVIAAWETTAGAYRDGLLGAGAGDWLAVPVPVERPN